MVCNYGLRWSVFIIFVESRKDIPIRKFFINLFAFRRDYNKKNKVSMIFFCLLFKKNKNKNENLVENCLIVLRAVSTVLTLHLFIKGITNQMKFFLRA